MSMIIYVMIHIESMEYIQNHRGIREIARKVLITTYTYEMAGPKDTLNMDDIC
jgi:hypothetical protein